MVFVHEAVLHWVYLNIQLNGLVIAVFIGFYVIRAADHVLTLILLILSALISLVHKLFLDYIWIIVGGGYIELPQMGVASMSTSRSRCIQNIMAINAQIFVRLSKLIRLITTLEIISHPVVDFIGFQNATLAYDVFGVISEIVTASTSFNLSR